LQVIRIYSALFQKIFKKYGLPSTQTGLKLFIT
jgi:hypothetical protein